MDLSQIIAVSIAFFGDTSIGGWVAPNVFSVAQHAHDVVKMNYVGNHCNAVNTIVLSTRDDGGRLYLAQEVHGDWGQSKWKKFDNANDFDCYCDWQLVKAGKMRREDHRRKYLSAA